MSRALSICIHGSAPTWMRAVAGLLRGKGEVVLALDSRVPEDELGQLEEVADRLFRYEYADPPERVIAWLAEQCSGDWILRLDHDEVPSSELLDRLPQLIADETLTHYWLERRWPYPTIETYLAEPPWWPDHEPRLVRNDSRFVRFPGVLHVPVEVDGPGAWIGTSIYHLDFVASDEETRRRKAEHWERVRPGMRLLGRPTNEVVYLPESRPGRALAPTPGDDVELIRAVLDAPAQRRPPTGQIPLAARAEIDAVWPARPLPESAYRASIELATPLEPIAAGEQKLLEARVRNNGTEIWPWGSARVPEIRLSYHWLTPSGEAAVFDGLRTPLPHDLRPDEELLMPLTVEAPAQPGDYVLQLELVHEGHRWFGESAKAEAHVDRPRRIALLAYGDPTDRLVELAFEHPECEVMIVPHTSAWSEVVSTAWGARSMLSQCEALIVDGTPQRRLDRAAAAVTRLVAWTTRGR